MDETNENIEDDNTGGDNPAEATSEDAQAPTEFGALIADDEQHAALLGSDTQPAVVELAEGVIVPLGDVVARAHEDSELSRQEWNDLPDDDREALLQATVENMRAEQPDPGEDEQAEEAVSDVPEGMILITITDAPASETTLHINGKAFNFPLGKPTLVPAYVLPSLEAAALNLRFNVER